MRISTTVFVRALAAGCVAVSAGIATGALAQAYPGKPIRVVFPFPQGGGTDIIGRPVLEEVAKHIGTTFIVENRGGSNRLIGADLPTFDESGLAGYEAVVNFAVLAPAGTPAPIVKQLEAAFIKGLAQPELRQRLEARGNDGPFGTTSEVFAAFIKAEIPKWAKVVRDSGAKVD